MINKRVFSVALSCLLFAVCFRTEAQQPKKVARIGYLAPQDATSESARAEAIRLALRELGYIEGQNIATEYRYAEGKVDRFPELAAELVRLKVDVIVASGGARLILAAKNATKTTPIVMIAGGFDPVGSGFIKTLAHPGGNITGLTSLSRELGGKRLELFKEAVPKVARVAILYDAGAPAITRFVKEDLPVAARTLGVTVRSWGVRDADSFERVIAALNNERPDGVYVSSGRLMGANQIRIVDFALKSRLPSVYSDGTPVDAGGLMSYSADYAATYPSRSDLCGQNTERRKARRFAGRTANKVRPGHQSKNRQTDRPHDSAQRAGESGQGDRVKKDKNNGPALRNNCWSIRI